MTVLAVIITVIAIIWSLVVALANGMSAAPPDGFKGGGSLLLTWLAVIIVWLAWWVG